jgi:hypothetical protein
LYVTVTVKVPAELYLYVGDAAGDVPNPSPKSQKIDPPAGVKVPVKPITDF